MIFRFAPPLLVAALALGCNSAGTTSVPGVGSINTPALVRVRVIEGVPTSRPFLDPALNDLAHYLHQHRAFGFVQLVDTTNALTSGGSPAKILSSAGDLEVELLSLKPEAAQLRVVLRHLGTTKLDLTLRSGPYKNFFVAGPKSPSGGVVFLSLQAQY